MAVNENAVLIVTVRYKGEDEFEELCFQYGIEIDEVVIPEGAGDADDVEYKIEVTANRYDLLCFEGIVHALRTFLGK
jgi:phenylalanyl-tRNA synthetase beta chain